MRRFMSESGITSFPRKRESSTGTGTPHGPFKCTLGIWRRRALTAHGACQTTHEEDTEINLSLFAALHRWRAEDSPPPDDE